MWKVRGLAHAATALSAAVGSAFLFSITAALLRKARPQLGSSTPPGKSVSKAFRGTVVHSVGLGDLEVVEDGLLTVSVDGKILDLVDLAALPPGEAAQRVAAVARVLVELNGRFLMPGLVDGHAHAPQYAFAGTGMDLPLLQWLETYTFPSEAKLADLGHARKVYSKAVQRHLRNGTTCCAWFATLHLEASKVLVDVLREHGQRAHVGKVSMDWNSPDYYVEDTEQGLKDVESFVDYVQSTSPPSALSDPVIATVIPRFVPSCTSEMMYGLAAISHRHCLPVHSHLSESPAEIAWVKELHPDCESYAGVYAKHNLLHERSYMAHCCHCCPTDRAFLRDFKAGVVHCPSSNFMLKSGVLNVRRMLNEDLKVGLGTDVAGGYSSSMLDALRQAMIASRVSSFAKPSDGTADGSDAVTAECLQPLSYAEAFHLATVGGAQVLGLSDKIGNFVPGKQFDALVVDPAAERGPIDLIGGESVLDVFEKFLFLGDDRNIQEVFVQGRRVFKQGVFNNSTKVLEGKNKVLAQ